MIDIYLNPGYAYHKVIKLVSPLFSMIEARV